MATCIVQVFDDGTDGEYGHEWDDDACCTCCECGFAKTVETFTVGSKPYREYKKLSKMPKEPAYICMDCAIKLGAKWPKGHVATKHSGRCGQCGECRGLCAIDDWDWPKGSKRPKGYGGGRD